MAKLEAPVDLNVETRKILEFIRKTVRGASANGVVVALSGGVDSAAVGALCVKALGPDKVLALLLPSEHTPKGDEEDARDLADSWGVRCVRILIHDVTKAFLHAAKSEGSRVARANVDARTRMVMAYYFANTLGYLVAGTGDRSEVLLGFYTKWGDGGVDFLPIAHLYKTQVRELAAHLGVPRSVAQKPASPQLWPGHRATDELPADYDRLDVVLHCLYDLRTGPAEAAKRAGVSASVVERVVEMHEKTEHKRRMPPSLG